MCINTYILYKKFMYIKFIFPRKENTTIRILSFSLKCVEKFPLTYRCDAFNNWPFYRNSTKLFHLQLSLTRSWKIW